MIVTAPQLLAHAVGDYVLQSDWQAQTKTEWWWPATLHAVTYGIPFLFLRPSLLALAVIIVSHYVIDRYRLARYVIWARNQLAPSRWRYTLRSGRENVGFSMPRHRQTPWLTTWLMIITDNIAHVVCNALALTYL